MRCGRRALRCCRHCDPDRAGRRAPAGGQHSDRKAPLRFDLASLTSLSLSVMSRVRVTLTPTTLSPEDVASLVSERDIRFIRLWFTDILGQLKAFSINATELERRVRGRDGLRRLLDHRLQPDRGVGHDRDARREHVRGSPLASGGAGHRRGCSATSRRPSARRTRATPVTCSSARSSAPRRWALTTSTSVPSSSTSTSATPKSTEVLDEGGYFDLTTLDAGTDLRRETVLALEQLGIHTEYTHHEVGPEPARDRHALRRRAQDGRRLHDLPDHGQGIRDEVRPVRDLHAQAAVRQERLGDAHPPVAVPRRGERLLRPRRRVLPLRRRQGVHRRPAPPRSRDLLDLRPVGQLLQAPRARLRGAGVRGLVAPQPLGAGARAAVPPRQGARDAHGAALPRPGVQPLPDVRGPAAGGARGNRARLRAA